MNLQQGYLSADFGWDAPLQYYYLTVSRGEHTLYSNLDDPEAVTGTFGGGLSLTQLQARLATHGFTVELDILRHLPTPPSNLKPEVRHLLEKLNQGEK